jgi:hypothetical protein
MSHRPVLRLFILAALTSLAGCNCRDPRLVSRDACASVTGNQPNHPSACADNSDCADHFTCSGVKERQGLSCCLVADRKCNTEADCCPGQTCPADRKKCFDKFLACETDTDCGDKGDRVCEVYADHYGESKRCRFRACSPPTVECPDGYSCFQNECLADLPCNGTCESGKGCVPSVDRCQDYTTGLAGTDRAPAACPMTCAPGFIATFKDNRNIWDSCVLPEVACVCAELPALRSDDLGRFSSIGHDTAANKLLVSAYDGQFGDLVVYQYEADGRRSRTEYIDGVPTGGTPVWGPSGPRKGVVEPGDDVGRYTDLAVHGGLTYVSYYDATHGDLKLATRAADGTWSSYTVDGATADLGLYSAIAIDSDGIPAIAYFQKGGDASFDPATCTPSAVPAAKAFTTALKVARATSANPGPKDWKVMTLGCQARPVPPCYACNQVCADPGTGAACLAASNACPTACDANTEICVQAGATAKCSRKYNPSTVEDTVDGLGLFPTLAFKGKELFVAYMRRTVRDGDLYGLRIDARGAATTPVLLDAGGDTGYFPDLKVDPESQVLALSYQDFSSKKLKFIASPAFGPGLPVQVIDTGAGVGGAGESHWVGADSSLVFGAGGVLYAVYLDASGGNLKLALRRGGQWQLQPPIRTQGAVGFFADAVKVGDKLYASHAKINARLAGGEPRVNNSLLVDQITAP